MVAVDICNLALAYLGDAATVASIDPPDGSAQAQHCARFYPMALNTLLEMHEWNFTTTRAYLAVVRTNYFDWRYAYAMPSTATDIISVLPRSRYSEAYWLSPFETWAYYPFAWERGSCRDFQVETVNGQQAILSNAEDAIARYTTSTVQPGMFPALFTDALAWRLAGMIAGPLLKGDVGAAESKRCLQMFAAISSQAVMQDANQRHDEHQHVPRWIMER